MTRKTKKVVTWTVGLLAVAGLGYGAYYYYQQQKQNAQLPPAGGTSTPPATPTA